MAEPTPVTVVTPDELQSFNAGATSVEQLGQLPQFFNTFSSQRGSGTLFGEAGGSYLDLRALGRQRTLVLLDGSRLPPADKRGAVNVDWLPASALLSSVDVVTGGASAAYGADALGGVVNYRINREFQGLDINIGTGKTDWGDGDRYNLQIAGGTAIGDKVNIIASFNATEIDEIQRLAAEVEERTDWYQNIGHVQTGGPGSMRVTTPCSFQSNRAAGGMIAGPPGFAYNGMVFTDDGQNVRQFVPSASIGTTTQGGDCDNPEYRLYQQGRNAVTGREVVNRSGFVGAQYEFNDRMTGFAQALIGKSESRFHNNLGGMVFWGGWSGTIFQDNAYLPSFIRDEMVANGIESFTIQKSEQPANPNNLDFGNHEVGEFDLATYSVGFDYEFDNGWALRASWQSGKADRKTGVFDEQRVDRTYMAMDAVFDANGAIVCNVNNFNPTPAELAASPSVQGRLASPGGVPGGTTGAETDAPLASPVGLDRSIENCTPLNILGLANHTLAAKDYISTAKQGDGNVEQDFAEVLLTGDFARDRRFGSIGFAAGLTYRDQDFDDQALPTDIDVLGPPLNAPELGIRGIPGGYTGGSANLHARSTVPNVDGGYDVWEWFGEVNVPVWESSSGGNAFGASLGVRQSDYSNLDDTLDSWKVGLELLVAEDLRFRATRSGDIREATFSERFDTQSGGFFNNDPFSGNTYASTVTSRGNVALAPEEATTEVIGLVYQPRWAPGLSMSADWYDVQVRGSIDQLGPQRVVDECYDAIVASGIDMPSYADVATATNPLCAELRISQNSIARVFNPFLNVAQARVKGVDYEIAYQLEPDLFSTQSEQLSLRLLAGTIDERSDTPFGSTTPTRFEGVRQGGSSYPEFQALLTAMYNVGPWSVRLTHRYIDDLIRNRTWTEGVHVDINTIDSADYTSAQINYTTDLDNGSSMRVSFDIANMFDDGPPLIAGGANQTVDPLYDIYGRRFFVSLNLDF